MAKLARLMSPDQSLLIQPAKLAASGGYLTGQLGLVDMQRISDLILNREGNVSYTLTFSKDDRGTIIIAGNLAVSLVVLCQRCLGEMELLIDNQIKVGIVSNQEEMKNLPDFLEPFMAEERDISLLKLIEDELILGLPLSPLHSPEKCPAMQVAEGYYPEKTNPFTVLKELKTGNQ